MEVEGEANGEDQRFMERGLEVQPLSTTAEGRLLHLIGLEVGGFDLEVSFLRLLEDV